MHAGLSGLDLPFAIANPGLRSRARSSPGYHMAGLRPWESGMTRMLCDIIPRQKSKYHCRIPKDWLNTPAR